MTMIIAATRICFSVCRQVTARLFYIVFLSIDELLSYVMFLFNKVQVFASVVLRKNHVIPQQRFISCQYKALFSLDNFHCWLISIKSISRFFSAVLPLFKKSFSTVPGYATNFESHLHIYTSLYLNICLSGSQIKRAFMLWRKTCNIQLQQ